MGTGPMVPEEEPQLLHGNRGGFLYQCSIHGPYQTIYIYIACIQILSMLYRCPADYSGKLKCLLRLGIKTDPVVAWKICFN